MTLDGNRAGWLPWPGLDTLYDFHAFVRSGPIARLPAEAVGKRVAIIGAGAAGLVSAYELLRLGGKYPHSPLMKLIVAPGLLLQALTTRYPDESQMEVAIASMQELLHREGESPASVTTTAA